MQKQKTSKPAENTEQETTPVEQVALPDIQDVLNAAKTALAHKEKQVKTKCSVCGEVTLNPCVPVA